MQTKEYWPILKETLGEYSKDNVPRLSAALAYYTAFSIAPVLVLILKVVSVIWKQAADEGRVEEQLTSFVGSEMAKQVQAMMQKAGEHGHGIIPTVISLVILCVVLIRFLGSCKVG